MNMSVKEHQIDQKQKLVLAEKSMCTLLLS